jgi:hypothetical protein
MMGIDSGHGSAVVQSFKIRKIEIWGAPKSDSDGAWQQAYIDWTNSTSFGSSKRVGDVSISNAKPLHVKSAPPKESVCNFWVQKTGIHYATISFPTGAVIDIHVSYVMADPNVSTPQLAIPLFFSPGQMKYGKLDQSTTATLVQQGLEL